MNVGECVGWVGGATREERGMVVREHQWQLHPQGLFRGRRFKSACKVSALHVLGVESGAHVGERIARAGLKSGRRCMRTWILDVRPVAFERIWLVSRRAPERLREV